MITDERRRLNGRRIVTYIWFLLNLKGHVVTACGELTRSVLLALKEPTVRQAGVIAQAG